MMKYSNRRPRLTCSSRFVVLGAAHVSIMRDHGLSSRRTGPLHCGTPDKVARHTACKLTQSPSNQNSESAPRRYHVQSPLCSKAAHGNSTSISSRILTSFPSQRRAMIHSGLPHNCEHHAISHRQARSQPRRLNFRRSPDYFCLYSLCPDKLRQNQG